jgi:two-component system phosphate regulon response regulator PhoB
MALTNSTTDLKKTVLVVEDEPDAAELVEYNLKSAGFRVVIADDGPEALRKARSGKPDLIILDLMLPEIDGIQVCKLLRQDPATKSIPILMLTAKAAEVDRILGLELGANDYVTKPFSPRELVLRVRNLVSRGEKGGAPEEFSVGDLFIDVPRHLVKVRQKSITLTAIEFRLLKLLVERRGRVQSRDQLLEDVWTYDSIIDTRTVDTHIRRLREKLGAVADYIDTVRGVGYRFRGPGD